MGCRRSSPVFFTIPEYSLSKRRREGGSLRRIWIQLNAPAAVLALLAVGLSLPPPCNGRWGTTCESEAWRRWIRSLGARAPPGGRRGGVRMVWELRFARERRHAITVEWSRIPDMIDVINGRDSPDFNPSEGRRPSSLTSIVRWRAEKMTRDWCSIEDANSDE
ncbi:hypothetical protein NL676_031379 [Syzygium grande]|nr:hypothetical protein NL676_031379 [Syzygium grande]